MILRLLAISILILNGCAPKTKPLQTEFVISSMVQALTAESAGGLYFAGRSSTGQEFSMGLASADNLNLVLNQGDWTFYTIAWAGPEPMTGEHRCDITQAVLAPGNQTVSIELAKAKCVDQRFGSVDADPALSSFTPSGTGSVFKNLNLNPCLDVSQVSGQGQNCRGLASTTYSHHMKGENLSFRVSLRPRVLPGMASRRLMSACIKAGTPGDFSETFYATNLKLPIGGSYQGLAYDIHGYEDQNCNSLEAIYRLPPLTRQISGFVYRLPPSSATTTESTLFFTDNFIGTGAPILGMKKAVIGCGVAGNEHCYPYVPQVAGFESNDFIELSSSLENLLSNGTEREAHTYGSRAYFHLFNGADLIIESTQAGSQFNTYSLDFVLQPLAPNPVNFSVDSTLKRITVGLNLDHGLCSNGVDITESACIASLATWTPTSFANSDAVAALNSLLASTMPELVASTRFPGNMIDVAIIPLGPASLNSGRDPNLSWGRMGSIISRIAHYTAGPYMNALATEGMLTCAAIPTSGAIERTFIGVENHFVRLEFGSGSTVTPPWLNGGSFFDKSIRFISDDGEDATLEFSCNTMAEGFLKISQDNRIEEIFWKTDSQATAQLEIYQTRLDPNPVDFEITRFQKINTETFEIITSNAYTGRNILLKARGTKDDLWIASTLGVNGTIDIEDVNLFGTDNAGTCFTSNGAPSVNCTPIQSTVPITPYPFSHNSWSTFATQNWNNTQFFDCPRGYIQVEGNSFLGTTNFCVMKYEARNVSAFPKSVPDGTPWVNIDRLSADAACGSLGAAYTLIDNSQWMTIAQAIELNPNNWNSGSVGTGNLFAGHATGTPAAICDSFVDAVGSTCATFSMNSFNKRTHFVGNKLIWDLSGNAKEWVAWDVLQVEKAYVGIDGSAVNALRNIEDVDTNIAFGDLMFSENWKPVTPGLTSDGHRIGKYYSGTTGGAAIRGGAYLSSDAGIYALDVGKLETFTNAAIGFRCIYTP